MDAGDEEVEDESGQSGKVLFVNDNDLDGDGIPDFADSYNRESSNPHDDRYASPVGRRTLGDETFVPMQLEVPLLFTSSKATVRFSYSASDPLSAIAVSGTNEDPVYLATSGHLRIWRKDRGVERDGRTLLLGGDYIPSDVSIPVAALGAGSSGSVVLYVEGVHRSVDPGDLRIHVEASEGGLTSWDEVRATAAGLEGEIIGGTGGTPIKLLPQPLFTQVLDLGTTFEISVQPQLALLTLEPIDGFESFTRVSSSAFRLRSIDLRVPIGEMKPSFPTPEMQSAEQPVHPEAITWVHALNLRLTGGGIAVLRTLRLRATVDYREELPSPLNLLYEPEMAGATPGTGVSPPYD
jgi:hypothetical protein